MKYVLCDLEKHPSADIVIGWWQKPVCQDYRTLAAHLHGARMMLSPLPDSLYGELSLLYDIAWARRKI